MKCFICTVLHSRREFIIIRNATTFVRGTALCSDHAVGAWGSISAVDDGLTTLLLGAVRRLKNLEGAR